LKNFDIRGIINTGVSCYANAVIQSLTRIPEFCEKIMNFDANFELAHEFLKFLAPLTFVHNQMSSNAIRSMTGNQFKENTQQAVFFCTSHLCTCTKSPKKFFAQKIFFVPSKKVFLWHVKPLKISV